MVTTFIGIDPGKQGAIAIISETTGEYIYFHDNPLTAGREMNGKAIYEVLKIYMEKVNNIINVVCFIEKAQAMPKQGVVSVFNYGKDYGIIIGVLQALRIPYQEIHAAKWKKEFALIKKDKIDSVDTAVKLFPQYSDRLTRKKKNGKEGKIYL